MQNNRLYLSLIFVFLPFLYLASIYGALPDRVPIHFDFLGNPDGWGPKYVLWLLPTFGIPLALLVNYAVFRSTDAATMTAKQQNIGLFTLIAISVLICYIIYGAEAGAYNGLGEISILTGLLFAALGNYFPVLPRNGWMGIRIPATLNSDYKWRKTHRFGGKVFFIGGILLVISGLLAPPAIAGSLLIGMTVLISMVSLVYASLLPDEEDGDLV